MSAAYSGDFGERAARGRHDGAARGHCFDDGETEAFRARDEEVRDGGSVERAHFVVGDVADSSERVGHARGVCGAFDARHLLGR